MHDAVIVGSGPNGLSAAVALAQRGLSVLVLEAHDIPGGGARSAELTLPGFLHDVCSTVHPLGRASPFFRSLELEKRGVRWRESTSPFAHAIQGDHAVSLERSVRLTAQQFGADAARYEDLMTPIVEHFDDLCRAFLGPLRFPTRLDLALSFGAKALRSVQGLARPFTSRDARALLAGAGAHAMLPLDRAGTAAFALVLTASAHAIGWPVAEGGSGAIIRALVSVLRDAGGEIRLGHAVRETRDLPPAKAYLFDVTPRQLVAICSDWLSPTYRRRLTRYRYGPGVFKIDWALSGAVPWSDERCRRATTIHLSGTLEDVHRAENAPHQGRSAERPFVLFVQPCLPDPSRAPQGKHIGWAYCHVPFGSHEDLTERIERHVESFAPGFRDTILARSSRTAVTMEQYNPNYVGGDINGGMATLGQLFFRPVVSLDPYATSNPRVFLCSSATPPGGGVHGLCGFWAAQSVLSRVMGLRPSPLG